MTTFTRREALVLAGAAVAAAGVPRAAYATAAEAEALIASFAGGQTPSEGLVVLDIADVAENGASVPVTVSVDAALAGDGRLDSVLLVSDGNPRPAIAEFRFSPLSASAKATTRVRLAQSQTVTALAKLADGSVHMAKKAVTVTVGGCAG